MGTVSGAAEALGVHHATVIRHVDALEKRLGVKLFQRHARGYTPTEAGRDLLAGGAGDRGPARAVRRPHPRARRSGDRRAAGDLAAGHRAAAGAGADLVSGGASGALRCATSPMRGCSGWNTARRMWRSAPAQAPEQPDNVVQPLTRQPWALYAAPGYIARRGMPADEATWPATASSALPTTQSRAPFHRWLAAAVPAERVIFRAGDMRAVAAAVRRRRRDRLPAGAEVPIAEGLVRGAAGRGPNGRWTLWLVTHVDLHRTTKVQAFLAHLKREAKSWAEA